MADNGARDDDTSLFTGLCRSSGAAAPPDSFDGLPFFSPFFRVKEEENVTFLSFLFIPFYNSSLTHDEVLPRPLRVKH